MEDKETYRKKIAMEQAGLLKKYDARETSMSSVLQRSTSLSLSRFATLIKAIKVRIGLKVGAMGILPQSVILPMKNLNRLQTKMEKLITAEAQWLTSEQLEQRTQYARYMRKEDAELPDMNDLEFTEAFNDLYLSIIDYYPNLSAEDAIDRTFMPPQGDNAWIMSNESEIISMNDGLNNIIKAPIILAKEMIQPYFITDEKTGEVRTEIHFKPYSELKLAADRFKRYDSLDIILEHQDWYDEEHLMGKVKNIRADDKTRTIRGMGYFYENKLPQGLKDSISAGEIIAVSIGFLAKLGDGGDWNGQKYDHRQTNILLRHLAIILDAVPRCPEDVCGINLKDAHDQNKSKHFIIKKEDNYYINICKVFKDSETETNKESIIKKQEEKIMHEDSEGKIKGDEPDDLEAILIRLRKFLEGNALDENATARILSAVGIKSKGDSEMEEKEFNDAIAKKDSEIEALKVIITDAKEIIGKYEEDKRMDLISKIKKFGNKYTDEELQKKDIDTLNIIAEEMEEKIKGKRIDFSKVFDDVNKEFGL